MILKSLWAKSNFWQRVCLCVKFHKEAMCVLAFVHYMNRMTV